MELALLTSLAAGAFAATTVLWLLGPAGVPEQAAARLHGLRDTKADAQDTGNEISLRRRAAVQLAGITLVSSNISANWTLDLERAGLTLNPKEYLILRLAAAAFVALVGMMLLPIPLLGIALAPLGYLAVGFWVSQRISSRKRKLEHQLVELISMVSSGLRAGFGFVQAIESAGTQMPEPISLEIRRTLRDIAVGASIEDALEALNRRVGSPDFDIVITAILIQRSVGGNLAEILDNVAHTMRERERIRGEIQTLTSQQRLTGYVIGGIPPVLFVIFYMMNPEFASLLFTESLGRVMLGAAVGMEVVGFLVIRRIVNIEV